MQEKFFFSRMIGRGDMCEGSCRCKKFLISILRKKLRKLFLLIVGSISLWEHNHNGIAFSLEHGDKCISDHISIVSLKTRISASQAALGAEAPLQKISQPIMPSDGQALRYRSIAEDLRDKFVALKNL